MADQRHDGGGSPAPWDAPTAPQAPPSFGTDTGPTWDTPTTPQAPPSFGTNPGPTWDAPTAPPPLPPGPQMPPTAPSRGNGVAIGIIAGVVGLVVAVPIVLIMAVTFLGTKAESSFQSVGSADPSGNGRLIPIDPSSSAPTEPSTVAPDLAAWCPTGAEVAAALPSQDAPLEPQPQPTTPLDMNDVAMDADLCYYGQTVDIGRISTADPDSLLAELALSSGRYVAGDGGLAASSVRLVLPGGESGAVRLVFLHGDQLLTVAVNGADDGRADALAALLLARPPG